MNTPTDNTSRLTPLELRRRIFHIALGWVIVGGLASGVLVAWHLFSLLVIGIVTSWAAGRWRLPVIGWCLELFDRRGTRDTDWPGRGALTYIIGVLLALQLFPTDVAYAAIIILAVGDGVSPLIGRFGRIRTGLSSTKLLEGTIGGALIGGAAAMLFLPPIEAFAASTVAMVFEAMEIRFNQQLLDDNIIVPLVAGTMVLLVRHIVFAI